MPLFCSHSYYTQYTHDCTVQSCICVQRHMMVLLRGLNTYKISRQPFFYLCEKDIFVRKQETQQSTLDDYIETALTMQLVTIPFCIYISKYAPLFILLCSIIPLCFGVLLCSNLTMPAKAYSLLPRNKLNAGVCSCTPLQCSPASCYGKCRHGYSNYVHTSL